MNNNTSSGRSHCPSCGQWMVQTREVPPPIRHLLRSHYAPVPGPHMAAPELEPLAWQEAVISDLQEDINHYMDLVEQLKYQREAHAQNLAERKGLLAPVRRLPQEILAAVMKEALSKKYTSSMRQLISLSHVSFTWRMAAFTDPTLWQRIEIQSDIADDYRTDDYISWLLAKSAQLPLVVDVNCRWDEEEESSFLSDAFDQIMVHSNRWKSLSFGIFPDNAGEKLALVKDCLPLLESLKLGRVHSLRRLNFDNLFSLPFNNTPLLKKLHVSHPLSPGNLFLPWHQLTALYCDHVSHSNLHFMFQECPFLETCRAVNICNDNFGTYIVTATHLTHLTIIIDKNDPGAGYGCETLFDDITLPSLAKVTIILPEWWDGSPIVSLLSRSSCEITHLTLQFAIAGELGTTDFAGNLPTLKRLDLRLTPHGPFISWMEIFAAIEVDGRPSYMPELKYLRIVLVPTLYLETEDEARAVASIVQSRCKMAEPSLVDGGISMLRSQFTFEISFDSYEASLEAVDILMALQDEGFNAHVYSIPRPRNVVNWKGDISHSTILRVADAGDTCWEMVRESANLLNDHEEGAEWWE